MIELSHVTLGYDHRAVLSDVSVRVGEGRIVGIIGPNGSGKSTLIRGITRLIRLFSGDIFVDERDLRSYRREEIARLIATVPQNPVLPEAFTAFEVVLMGRTPHLGLIRSEREKDRRIAWQAMEATQTQFLADRMVYELSGGERQRLVIARALTQQPRILLLDEPTAQLDINHQVEILDLIKDLSLERGLTVVVALHDLNLAAQYCCWLVMLSEGRVHSEGPPAQVLTAGNIKDVYGAEVSVQPHPINKLPMTVITRGESRVGRGL